MPALEDIGAFIIRFIASPTFLWVVFALFFGIFIVLSWILHFHWNSYGSHNKKIRRTKRIYYIGSFVMFIVLATLIALL